MNKREELIQLTTPLFLQHGFRGFTVNDIAKSLGVSKKTIYRYFDSKEELIAETKHFIEHVFLSIYDGILKQSKNPVDIIYGFINTVENEFGFAQLRKNLAEAKYYYSELEDDLINAHRETAEKLIFNFIGDSKTFGYVDEMINPKATSVLLGHMYVYMSTFIDETSELGYEVLFNEFIYSIAKVVFNEKGAKDLASRKESMKI